MKKTILIAAIAVLLGIGGYFLLEKKAEAPKGTDNGSDQAAVQAMYVNASKDLIEVDLPYPGAVTGKAFSIIGKARGTWYFEASFPVEVLDKDGKTLFQGPAQAQSSWMTEDFVPFKLDVAIPDSYIGPATVILKKDNPSGDPARDASVSFPITIEY